MGKAKVENSSLLFLTKMRYKIQIKNVKKLSNLGEGFSWMNETFS